MTWGLAKSLGESLYLSPACRLRPRVFLAWVEDVLVVAASLQCRRAVAALWSTWALYTKGLHYLTLLLPEAMVVHRKVTDSLIPVYIFVGNLCRHRFALVPVQCVNGWLDSLLHPASWWKQLVCLAHGMPPGILWKEDRGVSLRR